MKTVLYNILFLTLPFIVIVLLAAFYLEFFPNHFDKLTLVTIVIVFFVSCKIMPNKYI